ncbi:hypothetical protein QTP70_003606 [Hemibagrus guttatus]|uniref:Uncharacterized protein n=1 Tax=Hemibagrus guttatus TaxID=175788 RepID=A0AAE0QZ45_9TELE|nr:hypothetical protein QTP70_003606 [Hemibagrus guttatus]
MLCLIGSLPTSNAFLPDELNHFFARFDKGVIHHTRNADSSMVVHPISLSTTEVHSALSRVDPHDTTVVGRISKNDDSAYREEIQSLSAWCSMNNLTLNATKSKELIVDFLKSNSSRHSPIYINGSEVEYVSSLSSWASTSLRICLGIRTPQLWFGRFTGY